MGTSSNQRSPDTPSWRLARALIGSTAAPAQKQSIEMWRAATTDETADVIGYLCGGRTFAAAKLTETSSNPREAAEAFFNIMKTSGSAPFLDASASRALLRTVAKKGDVRAFAGELLSEAIAYYASRDLPSYVGRPGRIESTSQAVALKAKLQELARNACAPLPSKSISDANAWAKYVGEAIARLTSRKD